MLSRAGAAGRRAAGGDLPDRDRRARATAALRLLVGLRRFSGAGHPETHPHRRRPDRPVRRRQPPDPDRRHAADGSVPISSGLFEAPPKSIIVLPVLFEGQVKAVIELASLSDFTELQIAFLEQLTASIGIVLNSIEATMQTEGLLAAVAEARRRAADPAERAAADQRAARAEGARSSPSSNVEVERKNQEIEQARRAVEEKAAELALTSRYKSEFLANMCARAAHAAELDPDPGPAARREPRGQPRAQAGRVRPHHPRRRHRPAEPDQRHPRPVARSNRARSRSTPRRSPSPTCSRPSARPFRHEAESQGLSFDVQVDADLGRSIVTDSKRLQQILKNLLSNALKFTAQGSVRLRVVPAQTGWRAGQHGAQPGEHGGRLRGHRHRHRHPGREAEDRVRGLPAGRRRHQPQVRRHRPRPRHQPRARAACWAAS